MTITWQERDVRRQARVMLVCALAVSAVLAVLTPPANAATDPVLGSGFRVDAAMSPNGTAHLVWVAGDGNSFVYCRLPAGGKACSRTVAFKSPGGGLTSAGPAVFATGSSGVLLVFNYETPNETYSVASSDGGKSFGPQTLVATSGALQSPRKVILGPGNSLITAGVSDTSATTGPYVQSAPLGSVTTASTGPLSTTDLFVDASVAVSGGSTVVLWTDDESSAIKYRAGSGDLNQDASWGPMGSVSDRAGGRYAYGETQETAFGPGGLFLIHSGTQGSDLVANKWNGTGFGSSSLVARNVAYPRMSEAPTGDLHVVYQEVKGLKFGPVKYTHSTDGSTWDTPVTLFPKSLSVYAPTVNASGIGIIPYESGKSEDAVSFTRIPPAPVLGESVDVKVVKGVVKTKCKGQKRFTRLTGALAIPVGCTVDTTRGTIELTSAKNKAETQTARFYGGIFVIRQKKSKSPDTVLDLTPPRCGKQGKGSPPGIAGPVFATRGRRGGNGLWGSGKGNYTTTGKSGSGSVRGTIWFVQDRCDGSTFFRVKRGVVAVRDFVETRSLTLRAGQTYLAG